MSKVGLIGFGAIGQSIMRSWAANPPGPYRLATLLVRPQRLKAARAALPALMVTDDIRTFLVHSGDVVIEAAGHGAVFAFGEDVLRAGRDLYLLSVGALASPELRESLPAAAAASGGRILIPPGAFAGFQTLVAMRRTGLSEVLYTARKKPLAWRGTPAEKEFNLEGLTEPTVIFRGPADVAALHFPQNANVAAAITIAGIGFSATQVELIADPAIERTCNSLIAKSASSELRIELRNTATAQNMKSSEITGISVLAALEQKDAPVAFR